jgi:hypothetical protein
VLFGAPGVRFSLRLGHVASGQFSSLIKNRKCDFSIFQISIHTQVENVAVIEKTPPSSECVIRSCYVCLLFSGAHAPQFVRFWRGRGQVSCAALCRINSRF